MNVQHAVNMQVVGLKHNIIPGSLRPQLHAWICGKSCMFLRPSKSFCRHGLHGPPGWACQAYTSVAAPQDDAVSPQKLCWQELHFAAKLAHWSGFCYLAPESLQAAVEAEGLSLVAAGRSHFTSWYIADGVVHYPTSRDRAVAFVTANGEGLDSSTHSTGSSSSSAVSGTIINNTNGNGSKGNNSSSTSSSSTSSAMTGTVINNTNRDGSKGNSTSSSSSRSGSSTSSTSTANHTTRGNGSNCTNRTNHDDHNQRQCFVFVRGVQWSAPEMKAADMWRVLLSFWPTPLAASRTNPPGALVSHSGVTPLAVELFNQISPHLHGLPLDMSIAFTGHSLGGSIAKILWCLANLNRYRPPQQLSCHTFGSPPVMAHREGGGGDKVLQVLGSKPSYCRNFVLENDPVPRAFISADPYFSALRRYRPIQNLLAARSWLLGPGSLISSERFVFENVGEVYLMKGGDLICVNHSTVDSLLGMAVEDVLRQPARSIQFWLDHLHSSYAHDLAVAAAVTRKREAQQAASQAARSPKLPY